MFDVYAVNECVPRLSGEMTGARLRSRAVDRRLEDQDKKQEEDPPVEGKPTSPPDPPPRFTPEAEELEEGLDRIRSALEKRREVLVAFFHGSGAEGEPFHDLDVAVVVDRSEAPEAEDLRYSLHLADDLSQVAGYPVDVQVVNDAPPAFRDRVSRGRVLSCRSRDALVRFRERAWDEWFDFRPVARAYLREMAR